ncbi:hypothetical protein [Hyphobacterium sp.]|uniref:hypothetical protein n=1 Tax=Hyphobacterium sp. TaxID=2004662 RepID=UPI003BABEEA2
MKLIIALAGLFLLAASPPPPPPEEPEIAQGEFDGFAGRDIWRAWQRATYDAAANHAREIYSAYNLDRPGAEIESEGPRVERLAPYYWTETIRFAFNRVCDGASCGWRYHRVDIDGRPDAFDTIAEALFDGDAAAAYLSAAGIEPGMAVPAEHRAFGRNDDLNLAVADRITLTIASENECAAVADWQARFAAERTASAESPPPPPLPVNIFIQIDMPGTAMGSKEDWVRLEGHRDRALMNLASALAPPLDNCDGAE